MNSITEPHKQTILDLKTRLAKLNEKNRFAVGDIVYHKFEVQNSTNTRIVVDTNISNTSIVVAVLHSREGLKLETVNSAFYEPLKG